MEGILTFLPIVLYVVAITLLVVLIILAIKLMDTIDLANRVLTDLDKKSRSLNGFFGVIDMMTDTLSFVSDNVVSGIVSGISRIFSGKNKNRKNKKKEEDYDE